MRGWRRDQDVSLRTGRCLCRWTRIVGPAGPGLSDGGSQASGTMWSHLETPREAARRCFGIGGPFEDRRRKPFDVERLYPAIPL